MKPTRKTNSAKAISSELARKQGTVLLKIEMLTGNVSKPKLCRAIGISVHSLENEIGSDFPTRKVRLGVEDFLGKRLFSSDEEWCKRADILKRLGFDPEIATRGELIAFLRKGGVRVSVKTAKAELVEMVSGNFKKEQK